MNRIDCIYLAWNVVLRNCRRTGWMWLLPVLLLLDSCVRDEIPPCPPLQVNIVVKDKNYFNVDKVELENRLPEDLPLCKYVPTLYYRLVRLMDDGSTRVVEEQGLFPVEGEERMHSVTFDESLPHGTYVMTVWGGLNDLNLLSDDRTSIAFHPGNTEGADVYMVNDTLVYDAYHHVYTAELERTKGKLIIQAIDLPADVCSSEKSVNGLFGMLKSHRFTYAGLTEVRTKSEWTPGKDVVTKTLLAPSVEEKGSLLNVKFYGAVEREVPMLVPDDVSITMKRNELTVLKYVYEGGGQFGIYILVNDNWERVYGMEID